jgi:hypothetical protein
VAASARLDAELVRLGRHAAFGVRAERVAPRARVGEAGYREGERPAAPSVQITVPAGASEGAAFVVMGTAALIVGLELAVARLVLAMSVSDPYVLMGAIAVAALVLVVPARAARARRIELGPEEIVVHPPALLPWREATRVKTSRVRALAIPTAARRSSPAPTMASRCCSRVSCPRRSWSISRASSTHTALCSTRADPLAGSRSRRRTGRAAE